MKLIRAARVYRVVMPSQASLVNPMLETQPFVELPIGSAIPESYGFVPMFDDDSRLAMPFGAGFAYAMRLRLDEKVVPGSTIKAEVARRVKAWEAETGARMGRKAKAELKEETIADLTRRAFTKTRTVDAFYSPGDKLLIVATSTSKLADCLTRKLVQAIGSVKATTIYVSGAKHGLTTRLSAYLDDPASDPFEGFITTQYVKLKAPEGVSITLRDSSLRGAEEGLREALAHGALVQEIGLACGDVGFRLGADFVFRGVQFSAESEEDPESERDEWDMTATAQVMELVPAVNALCELLEYKEPPEDDEDLV